MKRKDHSELATTTHRVVAQAAALVSRFGLLCAKREKLSKEHTKLLGLYSRALAQYRRDLRVLLLMHATSDSEHFLV